MSTKQNIVVVGSGGGGLILVQTLQKQINPETHQLVVVEKRDYYTHWPALVRGSVTSQGSIAEDSLIPFDRAFDPSVRLVHSGAREINSTEVVTDSGEHIAYSYLVLATGSLWNGALALPDSRKEALEQLDAFRKRLDAAKNVVILGGGAVGIEYAGELVNYYPNTKVSLVHSLPELTNDTYPAKFRNSLLDALKKLGVQVVLGDRLPTQSVPKDGYITTEKGARLQADLVINATGSRPNTSVVSTLDSSALTSKGTVLVTPELNVKLASGARNVWAIGDIIEWPEQKMVFKASMGHAPIVAKNIIASIKGGQQKLYQGKPEMIVITIGPKGGRGSIPYFGGIVMGDWIAAKAKSADLFVSASRKVLGYGPPKTGSVAGTVLLATAFLVIPIAYALYLNGSLPV
ncbi:Apoptosis-inducing factor 2 OS=Taeniopygia guttata GN=AIFM2 PE=2 SV=1 [Rhizoctonia solani AG-1 IB]|uniref:Apoptosis-inducing factor 2 n=1 Tax=Thanatephorus cucumeris (strain AG1-IB / isolate 7/3/14) TaxID=1108050 RepID=A0A0B7FN01_THACB|nr:Apoptosis-inducing factor 2 OS=Taeniopygia guttata GN=AIFM2 PE=2 SV=1 [Rhizoctonia solani AG-1 IB]